MDHTEVPLAFSISSFLSAVASKSWLPFPGSRNDFLLLRDIVLSVGTAYSIQTCKYGKDPFVAPHLSHVETSVFKPLVVLPFDEA